MNKLQKLKTFLKKTTSIFLVVGLLVTTYGFYLNFTEIYAQAANEMQAQLGASNSTYEDFNKPPYHSANSIYAQPDHTIRLYQFYGNKTASAMNNVEVVMQAPVTSSGNRAAFYTGTADPTANGITITYSNDNATSFAYTPSGAYDSNVTHIKWTVPSLAANTIDQAVQARFRSPSLASSDATEQLTSKGYTQQSAVKLETNSVTITNITKPEFNKLTAAEVENTLTGTNDITTLPTPWSENTSLQMGQEFGLRVYARNVIPNTEAKNLKIRLEFPTTSATTHTVKAYLSADNAETLIDTTQFTLPQAGTIRYLNNAELTSRGSCKLSWKEQRQYKMCGDEIATTGYIWVDGSLKYGSAETLQLTVEAIVEQSQPSSTPTITPSATPYITATPSSVSTTPPVATQTPVITPTGTPVASATPIIIPSATVTATPTIVPSITPTASPSSTPSITPAASPSATTQLKFCKYEDDNGDGVHNNGENTMSWKFFYTIDGQQNIVESHWWHVWSQGCAIVTVPADKQIEVTEEARQGWRMTAMFADGARADDGLPETNLIYRYTSSIDDVKVMWFLNTFTPNPVPSSTPAPTATASASPTTSPSVTPSPSPTPVVTTSNSNYNVTIEKRVDGSRVDGDKVGIQYRVKVKNNSDSNFNNFEVRDTLPPDFTYDQNTTEGDINTNPEIQDVTGDDNRRLVWKVSLLEKGKEINFGYRTTGKKEDKNYCNDAKIEKDGNVVSTSQACVRVDKAGEVKVLAATTTKTLPSTGAISTTLIGIAMLIVSGFGYKLSKHVE